MSNVKSKRGRLRSLLLCCAFCAVFLTGFVAGAGSIACYLFLQPSAVPIFREANAVPVFYLRDELDRPESGVPSRQTASDKFYSVHSNGEADDVIHFRSSPPAGTEHLAALPMSPPSALDDFMEIPVESSHEGRTRELIYSSDEKVNAAIQQKRAAQASERRGTKTPAREQRPKELIYTSENFRKIADDWERIWFLNNPNFNSPYRTETAKVH